MNKAQSIEERSRQSPEEVCKVTRQEAILGSKDLSRLVNYMFSTGNRSDLARTYNQARRILDDIFGVNADRIREYELRREKVN